MSHRGLDGARPTGSLLAAEVRTAVAGANIPTLVMVLFHLTGDERWLESPYQPTRTPGITLHDGGGLSETIQAEVRDAAVDAILSWDSGVAEGCPDPDVELLQRLLSVCVGEPVPRDYAVMMAEEMGFAERDVRRTGPNVDDHVVIVGAGVSGMILAVSLQDAGIPFTIIERNDDVGGTWLENRYPGARVDTPSYLYSYSRFTRNWPTHFSRRDEVVAYLSDLADNFGLRKHMRLGTSVTAARFDERSGSWNVDIEPPDGPVETVTTRYLVTAVGLLSQPKLPDIAGLDEFAGPMFHSAQWPDGIDLDGSRVAVIGSGASAMQIVPAIVDRVAHLTIHQRSPQWVASSDVYFESVPSRVHWLMENVPYYHRWFRFRLAWAFNDKIHESLRVDPEWHDPERSVNAINDAHRAHFTRYLESRLDGRDDLIEAATPDYPPYGKRILLDNGWFAALLRDHVELVTEPVSSLTDRAVVSASGVERPADVVIFCTGFDTTRLLHPLEVIGREGSTIRDAWGDDDPRAYLGMSAPGFPNLFFLYGPNTNPGGGSWITIAEAQARYLTDLMVSAIDSEAETVEVRSDVFEDFNGRVDAAHETLVWTHPGMRTYFRNESGRVVTNWPWRVVDYWHATRAADLDDFEVRHR